MAAVVLVALILLNTKILKWWKPVLILIIIAAIVFGATFDRWGGEVKYAINSVSNTSTSTQTETSEETSINHRLQYIDTDGFDVYIGVDEHEIHLTMYPDAPEQIRVLDGEGVAIEMARTNVGDILVFDDERFTDCFLQPATDDVGNYYYIFTHDHQKTNWAFRITEDGVYYLNNLGALVDLDNIPSIGWDNNGAWGNGRGYIFSRTLPMMKNTMLVGYGADTFCLYFPHKDYVGKMNSVSFTENVNIVVDKPHNMYMGAWVGTGGISVLALLAMFAIYAVQSLSLYFKNRYESTDFASYAGVGIFLGIVGFLTAALVDDSSVSVMPMFYALLGTGIATNMLLKRRAQNEEN